MFVEQRSYTVAPGKSQDYLALYEQFGMPAQLRYIPWMLGYYRSEIGDLNIIVHLWGHSDLVARDTNRQAMLADPDFQSYFEKVRPLIVSQKTQILRPVPFFMDRLRAMIDASVKA